MGAGGLDRDPRAGAGAGDHGAQAGAAGVRGCAMSETRTLEVQRAEFKRRRLLAMPIAGTIVWAAIGIAGAALSSPMGKVWALFIGTGSIAYIGMLVSKHTGENFLDKSRPKNDFDRLFFMGMAQALLVFAIAIPFFMKDYTSAPMTVGILTGLMWLPLS